MFKLGRRSGGARPTRRAPVGALALVLGLVALLPGLGRAAQAYPPIFGSSESRHDNIRVFSQWSGVIDRMNTTPEPFTNACEGPKSSLCHLKEWNAFLASIKGLAPQSQLDRVNAFMNKYPYVQDIVNWGVQDYWETPLEFLYKSGECKDYAIAKYMSLRYLGWPAERLRVVVLQDLNLQLMHAILAVYTGDQIQVLDNQISQVVGAESIHHYRAVYSVNEQYWWLHQG